MNTYLAELSGLHAGDGTIYKTNRGLVWELRGGHDEQEFYDNHITQLLSKISTATFTFGKRSGGTYGVRTCNKEFINKLLNEGFSIGSKTFTVCTPKSILTGKQRWKAAYLRGIFATDGCITLTKINGKQQPTYPRISLKLASNKLMSELIVLLDEYTFNIRNGKTKYGRTYINLNGLENLREFENKIGIIQPKHRQRVQRYL